MEVPPLATFADARHVLVGDAAHAMAPNLGRGACESLRGAVTLSRCLARAATVHEGLRAYDRARRAPTRRLVRLSRILNQISTATRLTRSRDTPLQVVPAPARWATGEPADSDPGQPGCAERDVVTYAIPSSGHTGADPPSPRALR